MKSLLLALLLSVSLLALAEPRLLGWQEMIPADAPPAPEPLPQHAGLSPDDAPIDEYGPGAPQQQPDAPVVAELNGQQVRLPGYLVPLQMDEQGRLTEFLLVPYYGACIHVPPPPSNQIVYVSSAEGVLQEALYQPYWIEGRLQVQRYTGEVAAASYSMQAERVELYELEP